MRIFDAGARDAQRRPHDEHCRVRERAPLRCVSDSQRRTRNKRNTDETKRNGTLRGASLPENNVRRQRAHLRLGRTVSRSRVPPSLSDSVTIERVPKDKTPRARSSPSRSRPKSRPLSQNSGRDVLQSSDAASALSARRAPRDSPRGSCPAAAYSPKKPKQRFENNTDRSVPPDRLSPRRDAAAAGRSSSE